MKVKLIIGVAFFATLFVTSCVTSKKYHYLSDSKELSDRIADSLDRKLYDCGNNVIRKTKEITTLKNKLDSTDNVNNLLRKSLKDCNDLLGNKQKDILAKNRANDSLNANLWQKQKRVEELESALAKKDSTLNAMHKKISDALKGFGDELNVYTKNGKVHIAMSDKLLFKSGSIVVEDRGVQALQEISKVFSKYPTMNVFIEGHTDNVALNETKKRLQIKDNWDLSVLRSTSITRHLIDNGLKPLQILPSGRGENDPIADNSTEEGRAKNRRTEIIIEPNLEEIFQLLEVKTISK